MFLSVKPLRKSPIIPLVVTLCALLACNFPLSNPQIENAFLARDYEGRLPTSIFMQQDTFYGITKLIDSPEESTVKATWIATNTDGIEPGLIINETETNTSSGIIHFELKNETPWPKGFYRLTLFSMGN